MRMLQVYRTFAEEYMAMAVICGKKSERERFPGAVDTLCIEAMMQDGKALQAGTSHFLGQNFSRACSIQFTDRTGKLSHAWTTSWGISTRLMGALIMTHSDDNGLVLPPKLAPQQLVILPIVRGGDEQESVFSYAHSLRDRLRQLNFAGQPLRVHLDMREKNGGEKSWEWIKKGVPLRMEVGRREIVENSVCIGRRDSWEKFNVPVDTLPERVPLFLEEMQQILYGRALHMRNARTQRIRSLGELEEFFRNKNGFAEAYFSPDEALEERLQKSMGITLRCFPLTNGNERKECFVNPQRMGHLALWARAY
jgi:prolyl-tRNA synthetase